MEMRKCFVSLWRTSGRTSLPSSFACTVKYTCGESLGSAQQSEMQVDVSFTALAFSSVSHPEMNLTEK